MCKRKGKEAILSRDFITVTDVMMLFSIGKAKAEDLFDKVQKNAESEGKINIPGRISWRRLYRMLGQPIPKLEEVEKAV